MRRAFITTGLGALMFATVQLTMAAPVDSNSIIKNGIECYIQTDKAVYNLGENVEMLYRVTNLRNENVTFGFPYYPVYQFWVDKNGEQIWSAVNFRLSVVTPLTLIPGESREFPNDFSPPFIWNMRDNGNDMVNIGTYNVIGGLDNGSGTYDYTKVAVSIDIIPEPTTLFLLGIGGLLLRRRS